MLRYQHHQASKPRVLLRLKHANNTEFRTEVLGAKWPNFVQQQGCLYGPTQSPCSIPDREVAAPSICWFSSDGGRHHWIGCRLWVLAQVQTPGNWMIDEVFISWNSSVHEMKRHSEEQANVDDAKAQQQREQSGTRFDWDVS